MSRPNRKKSGDNIVSYTSRGVEYHYLRIDLPLKEPEAAWIKEQMAEHNLTPRQVAEWLIRKEITGQWKRNRKPFGKVET